MFLALSICLFIDMFWSAESHKNILSVFPWNLVEEWDMSETGHDICWKNYKTMNNLKFFKNEAQAGVACALTNNDFCCCADSLLPPPHSSSLGYYISGPTFAPQNDGFSQWLSSTPSLLLLWQCLSVRPSGCISPVLLLKPHGPERSPASWCCWTARSVGKCSNTPMTFPAVIQDSNLAKALRWGLYSLSVSPSFFDICHFWVCRSVLTSAIIFMSAAMKK